MLHKEMVELKRSIKKNLKITDMPDLDSSDDEEEFEENLKSVSRQNQNSYYFYHSQ